MTRFLDEMPTKEILKEVARELSVRALMEVEDVVGNTEKRVNDLRRKLDS